MKSDRRVYPDSLVCHLCRYALPDHEFAENKTNSRRRYRHSYCRACMRVYFADHKLWKRLHR